MMNKIYKCKSEKSKGRNFIAFSPKTNIKGMLQVDEQEVMKKYVQGSVPRHCVQM